MNKISEIPQNLFFYEQNFKKPTFQNSGSSNLRKSSLFDQEAEHWPFHSLCSHLVQEIKSEKQLYNKILEAAPL